MRYTLSQACKTIESSSHAFGVTDVKDSINRAIQALSGLAAWECLRKTIRFISAGPEFALPQGSAGLVRVCVNGNPVTLRGQDFRFIHSGPGDAVHPPQGFCKIPMVNVLDLGCKPVMVDICSPSRLFAFSDKEGDDAPVVVRGVDPTGRVVTESITPYWYGDPARPETVTDISDAVPTDNVFQIIDEVVIDDCAAGYVTLYAETDGHRYPIALYHPDVKAPEFHHYRIRGVPPCKPVEILAETRVDPLPLVRPTDIVPFASLEPIEWMIRYDWCMKAGEVDAASKYQAQAAQWLKAQEITDDTVQTPIIVNSVFERSMGEISEEAYNI